MNEQLKNLWHLAFGDGEEFIDLFFRTAFDPEKCLYLEEEGQITAIAESNRACGHVGAHAQIGE